jgi:hypothetical protein
MSDSDFQFQVWEAEFWFAVLLHRDNEEVRRQVQAEMLNRKPIR